MKIGIVLHPYGEKKPGGLPRIIYGWAEALIAEDSENQYIVYLKEKPAVMPTFGGRAEVVVLGSGRFWLNRLRKALQADVYLFNTPVLPLFWKPKRTVLIALDYPYMYLKAEGFKEKLFRVFIRAYHRYSLKRVDHIIAVSHSTEKDTVRFFNIPQEKISVIYHGFTNVGALPESPLELPEKFFFFAGTMKERKNVLNIIKAFEIFLRRAPSAPHSLVLAGKNEGLYYEQLLSYIKKVGLENRVKFMGHLNVNQLSFCYKRAEALVFTSIVEGTGFPILEAMSASCPVITSNIFGPAELGANGGALLVNPYKPEEIASAMDKIVNDAGFRTEQIKRGIEQARRFSWTNTGLETLELLTKVSRKEKWRMMHRLNLATKILTPLSFILSPFIFPFARFRRTEEKILIVPHLTRVGEVVVATPVIVALKARFPNAKIYALVSMKVSGLLEADPNIHELIIIEKYKYNLRGLLSRIRGERFKIAISLSGTPWSSLLFFFGLIPERFKLVQENRPFINLATDWLSNRRAQFKNSTSILSFYEEMLKPLGIEKLPAKKLYASKESEIIAQKYFDELRLPPDTKIIGISVTAGNKVKEWGIENFTKLIKILLARFPEIHIVIIGTKQDAETINPILSSISDNRLQVLYLTGLNQLAAHMKHFNLFISVDTGPMHVADAFQIPLIDIIGPASRTELTPRGSHVHIVEPTPSVPPTIFAFKDAGDPILTRKALDQTSPEAVFVVAEKCLTE